MAPSGLDAAAKNGDRSRETASSPRPLSRGSEMADDALDVALDAVGEGQCRLAVQRPVALGLPAKVARNVFNAA